MRAHPSCLSVSALAIALVLASACALTPEPPPQPSAGAAAVYEEGEAGGVYIATAELSARVAAIDRDKRSLTLLGPEGNQREVGIGPEVRNFDQIAVGDRVVVTLTEQLVVALGDPSEPLEDAGGAGVALAPVGAKPGAIVVDTVRATGTVTELDPKAQTATLLFADGSSRTFAVRPDVDLTRHKPGEQVILELTKSLAIDVRKD